MTTITIELPDDVAEQARRRGLLSASAISGLLESALLREQTSHCMGNKSKLPMQWLVCGNWGREQALALIFGRPSMMAVTEYTYSV